MLKLLSPWMPRWQSALMPPSPSAAAPACSWVAATLARADLGALRHAPAGTTLLAPTDDALARAGVAPADAEAVVLQRWLLGHLTLGSPRDDGLLPLLDGSLLRRAEGVAPSSTHAAWLDAAGHTVNLPGRPWWMGQLRVQPIDRVLSPAVHSVADAVAGDPSLSRLAEGLVRCGLAPILASSGPFTLLAPSNAALDRAAARLGLSAAGLWHDTERLRALLLRHVVPGRWSSAELPWPGRLRTLAEGELTLDAVGRVRSGDLGVPLAPGSDQPCTNGVLHRVPEVLLPAGD